MLAVVLVHAAQGLADLTLLTWRRHLAGWFPALPASLAGPVPGGAWPTVINAVDCVWIVIFVALVLGHHRMARVVAALAIAVDLVFLLQAQFAGLLLRPLGTWSSSFLLDFALDRAEAEPSAVTDRAASHERLAPQAGRRVPGPFHHALRAGQPRRVRPPGRYPVTITSAAVSAVSSFQPRTPSGLVAPGPPSYQIMITLPAADVAAATAVVTTAYDSRGGVDFSVAGRTWALPMVFRPFRSQQLPIDLPTKNQALQLHRLLVSSG